MAEKLTTQTKQVLDLLKGEYCHLTAEEILARLDNASTATVYRSLEQLCRQRLIRTVQTDGRKTVYEAARTPHLHMICRHCGSIFDIRMDMTALVQEAAALFGHQVDEVQTTAYGICRECAQKQMLNQTKKEEEIQ